LHPCLGKWSAMAGADGFEWGRTLEGGRRKGRGNMVREGEGILREKKASERESWCRRNHGAQKQRQKSRCFRRWHRGFTDTHLPDDLWLLGGPRSWETLAPGRNSLLEDTRSREKLAPGRNSLLGDPRSWETRSPERISWEICCPRSSEPFKSKITCSRGNQ